MDLSLVIPIYNEEESLVELVEWINEVLLDKDLQYEILMIDDGSTDQSWHIVSQLSQQFSFIKGVKFRRNYGKSAALNTGFHAASGNVVITMDADLQDNPNEIPELYRMIQEDQYDMVSGWKKKRNDPINKRWPSKFYNFTVRKVSGIPLHDFNCGLKSYKKDVVKSIEVYGEMHRYIPLLAKFAGFKKIGEKVVDHRPRKYGTTKFGMERYIKGYLDLISISFMGRFAKKPMHFFGGLGTLSFVIGFIILVYLSIAKLVYQEYGIADRPLFYFGIVTLIIGTQLFVTGFLAELVSRMGSDRNKYLIDQEIGF